MYVCRNDFIVIKTVCIYEYACMYVCNSNVCMHILYVCMYVCTLVPYRSCKCLSYFFDITFIQMKEKKAKEIGHKQKQDAAAAAMKG